MPVYVPQANQPRRTGRMQSLGEVFGSGSHATTKRPVMKGNYSEPSLPFPDRMKWLANVQRLVAGHSAEHHSYPHKVYTVASAMAHIGDVCRLSLDGIAERAGCVVSTVEACIAWLEEQGALTWGHTARKHSNGRMVRSSNLYTLITNFAGVVATVAKALRAIWRERPGFSNPNVQPGLTQTVNYKDQEEARRRLAEISKERQAALAAAWNTRNAT
jgi:hypothetical protein